MRQNNFVIPNPTRDRCEKIISFLKASNYVGFGVRDIAMNLGYKNDHRAYRRIQYATFSLYNKGILLKKGPLFRIAKDGRQVWEAFSGKNEAQRLSAARRLASELVALFA